MTTRFEGKSVLVTGGTTGIGLATAKLFVDGGASVFVIGRSETSLEAALADLGSSAIGIQGDITARADVDRLFATIAETTGQLDIVVANAGGGSFTPLGSYTDDAIADRFDVNIKGTIHTIQGALPLIADGGSIVLVGSISGSLGMPGLGLYGATKAGLRSFGRTWANELKDRRIRVNVVSPGHVYTAAHANAGISVESFDDVLPSIPLGRLGKASEIASAIAFLASNDSSYVTGAELVVDGGLTQV